eukprot:6240162-Pyramimonas_sp.AAC.1
MSQAKRAGAPRARHLGDQSCSSKQAKYLARSGETGRRTSRETSGSPELRGCLGQNRAEYLAHGPNP